MCKSSLRTLCFLIDRNMMRWNNLYQRYDAGGNRTHTIPSYTWADCRHLHQTNLAKNALLVEREYWWLHPRQNWEYIHVRLGMMKNSSLAKRECWWLQLCETFSSLQTCEMWIIATMWFFLSAYKPERNPLRRVRGSCLKQIWSVEMTSSSQRVEKNSIWLSNGKGDLLS